MENNCEIGGCNNPSHTELLNQKKAICITHMIESCLNCGQKLPMYMRKYKFCGKEECNEEKRFVNEF